MPSLSFTDRAMSSRSNAIQADKKEDYAVAFEQYTAAAQAFMTAEKHERNVHVRPTLRQEAGKMISRAEEIKGLLENRDKRKPAATAMNGNGKSTDGADENVSQEKQKLMNDLSNAIMAEKPDVRWSDVAGLELAKVALQEAAILPAKFPQLFIGKRKPWSAILLYGPPGTGKSYLAKALATEANSTFISVSSSDVVDKWMGEAEKRLRALFELARKLKPSVIFMDEIDSISGRRGDGESEAARRLKTELLVQLQGVGQDNQGVLFLGATNIPWEIDDGFLRRFQRRVYIPLPEMQARRTIFELGIGDTPCDVTSKQFQMLAEMTDHYSGSDINTLTQMALMQAVRKVQEAKYYKEIEVDGVKKLTPCSKDEQGAVERDWTTIESEDLHGAHITKFEDFLYALDHIKSTVSPEALIKFEKWTKEFGSKGS